MQTYRDIAKEIERRILGGIYPAGSQLPSRLELMREFNVARATLDRAVKELVNSRRLSSRRGSGTSVNPLSEHRRDIALIGWDSIKEPEFNGNLRCCVFKTGLLARRSNWNMLYEYDGLLWRFPGRSEMAVIEAVNGRIPQVVVNRVIPGVNCISTDHRGAYRAIVSERMEQIKDALPVFMSSGGDTLPGQYRFEGFSDACRSAGRFYELWNFLPEQDFRSVSDEMSRRISAVSDRKLLVVADSCQLTGAFVRAVDKSGLKFAEDIWYSDFDNEYPENVWGVKITSFIQDYGALMRAAADRLEGLLNGSADPGPEHKLIFPLRRNGDT